MSRTRRRSVWLTTSASEAVGDGPESAPGRYGEPAVAGAIFRCGACGGAAALVKLLRAGELIDMGPPLGEQRHQHDGVIIDYWLGTSWIAANPAIWARVSDVLTTAAA